MEIDTYILFVLTTAVIVVSPGAAAIAIASQGASNGGRRALLGVTGVAVANVVYFALSATGIAALIIASNTAFSVIKWLGVGYLVYLGLMALFSKAGAINVRVDRRSSSSIALFLQGFIIEIANPKALLYFSAILPQFLNPQLQIMPQILLMGITTVVMDMSSYSVYAFLGERLTKGGIKDWLASLINKTAGGALLYTGYRMANVSATRWTGQ